ncbi:hemagglutinin, partial [Burkholderia thailandensis]|nr:hemagglutinin [Burkholderia thailandensis]
MLNRIFRVVFSRVRGAWIVVSEHGPVSGKQSKSECAGGAPRTGFSANRKVWLTLSALAGAVALSLPGVSLANDVAYFNDGTDPSCTSVNDASGMAQASGAACQMAIGSASNQANFAAVGPTLHMVLNGNGMFLNVPIEIYGTNNLIHGSLSLFSVDGVTANSLKGIANGTVAANSYDAVNGGQLFSLSTSVSTGLSTTNSNLASLSTSTSTGLGSLSTGLSTTDSNLDSLSTSTAAGLTSLSTGLSTTYSAVASLSTGVANSVQYDDPTHASVTLGGTDAGAPVTLTNVAEGVNPTDAVNFGQLTSLSTATLSSISSLSTGLSTTDSNLASLSTSTSTGLGSLSTGLSTTDSNLASLSTSTSTGLGSLSAGLSTTDSNLASLSTSTSTGLGSLSTGLSTTNSNLASLSTSTSAGLGSLSTGLSTTDSNLDSLSTSTAAGLTSLSTGL